MRYFPATLSANEDRTMLPLTPQTANTTLVVDSSHSAMNVPRKKSTPIKPKATDEITKVRVAIRCMLRRIEMDAATDTPIHGSEPVV